MSEHRADPWGWHEPPLVPETDLPPLTPRLAGLAGLARSGQSRELARDERFEFPSCSELTEMADLRVEGWRPLDAGPELELLPAVWPPEHRGWLPDRLPGIGTRLEMPSRRRWLVPHPPGRNAEVLAELNENARRAGLPGAPPGRLWLLRSPWPDLGMALVLTVFRRLRDVRDERDDHDLDAAPGNTVAAAHELLRLDEAGVLSHLSESQRVAVEAWRREGRTDEEVAAFAQAGLHPHHAQRLTAPIAAGGAGLDPDQAPGWVWAVSWSVDDDKDAAVERVVAWRALSFPAAADERPHQLLDRMDPADAGRWLEAGYSFDEIELWRDVDLDTALAWRQAGFAGEASRALVDADPELTPEEAMAFDAAAVAPVARLHWVAAGFTAQEARAYTDSDVVASEARVWRASGLGPLDAQAHRAAGGDALPPGAAVGWGAVGPTRDDRNYGVTDPPGTRGVVAGHRHPLR